MPALLRVRLGIDEVVTTLLLNPVALLFVKALVQGPWRDPSRHHRSRRPSPRPPTSRSSLERSRLHLGFLIALVIIVVAWYVLTPDGDRAAGARRRASRRTPRASRASAWSARSCASRSSAAPSRASPGSARWPGIQYRLTAGLSPGFGYTGIVVAMLGGLTMPGVLARPACCWAT